MIMLLNYIELYTVGQLFLILVICAASFPFEVTLPVGKQMRLWFVTNPGIVRRVILLVFILGSQN